jgi:hypothetical protein
MAVRAGCLAIEAAKTALEWAAKTQGKRKGPGGHKGASRASRRFTDQTKRGAIRKPPQHYAGAPYAGLTHACHAVS